jgi:hypothetical protein
MEELILLEAEKLPPMQKQSAVVAVGRFSVPTIGHYRVINAMKNFIRKNKKLNLVQMPIIVIVDGKETRKDKSKNPLTPDQRIKFMKASGKANGVIFLVASSAFDAFAMVRKQGYEPVAIAAGSDRADGYLQMLDKYFKSPDDKQIVHHIVPGLERKNEKGVNEKNASGTMARLAAKLGHYAEFVQVVGLEDKEKLAKQMYAAVIAGMKEEPKEDKKDKE